MFSIDEQTIDQLETHRPLKIRAGAVGRNSSRQRTGLWSDALGNRSAEFRTRINLLTCRLVTRIHGRLHPSSGHSVATIMTR